jgi:cyclophilin family peptidyl-prolyl cis-trans isomerase
VLKDKLLIIKIFVLATWSVSFSAFATSVIMETPLGNIEIELFDEVTPGTVENFLNYVNDGDYEDSFVHRSVPGFVIQGGGFIFEAGQASPIPTDPPIENEFRLSNVRGTIAMAKLSGNPDSATSQWFINLADNSASLDGGDGQGGGFFTVFGQVIGDGMEVADAISALPRVNAGGAFNQLPVIDFSGGTLQPENMVFAEVRVADVLSTFEINPGLSGAWFNPETSGQGWLFDVIEGETGLGFFVAWFTYDDNPPAADELDGFGSRQHRWFTASGDVSGDTAALDIFLNSGGVFNDPRETMIEPVGSMTIQFSDCTNAQLSFDFDASDDKDGSVDIIRLSPDVFCQAIVDAAAAN